MIRRNDWFVYVMVAICAIGMIIFLDWQAGSDSSEAYVESSSRTESGESDAMAQQMTTTEKPEAGDSAGTAGETDPTVKTESVTSTKTAGKTKATEKTDEKTTEKTTKTTQPETESVDRVALPDTLYAVVDQPLVIRFLNIIGANSLEGLSVKMETGGKGKVYADRWEYTPTTSEKFSFAVEITDRQGALVNKSTHTVQVKEATQKKALTVLVLGDSTVEGGYETKQMRDLAIGDGREFTLLGTRTTSYVNDENNRHEGRGGWRASTYVEKAESKNTGAVNAFFNPATQTFDFSYYMETQGYASVDCVCIQLGINDMFGARTDAEVYSRSYIKTYFEHMDTILESIHQYDPAIKIVWNLILPGSVEQEKFEERYGEDGQTADRYKKNTYLANLEIIKHAQGLKNVYVAPTNAPLNTVENMGLGGSGAVHPARKGYCEIGTMLYSFVCAINE